jgi:hypothetical protein
MKKFILILISFAFTLSEAQTVLSYCNAPDSVIKKYKKDADGLSVNRVIFKITSPYTDSVVIDPSLKASYLKALLAVYNATALPARDTVVSFLKIHRFLDQLNQLYIQADTNYFWMQNLRNNIIPTGKSSLDSLMTKYYLQKTGYISYGNLFSYAMVVFKTDTNYNMFALANNFNNLLSANSSPDFLSGDGSTITDSINPNFIQLTYKYGWGDCMAGCINKRYWKFRIYNDCSVEYLGSYGTPFHYVGIKQLSISDKEIKIYPNPTTNKLFIEAIDLNKIVITNCLGQTVLVLNDPSSKQEIDLSSFTSGVYFLTVEVDSRKKVFKIIKE